MLNLLKSLLLINSHLLSLDQVQLILYYFNLKYWEINCYYLLVVIDQINKKTFYTYIPTYYISRPCIFFIARYVFKLYLTTCINCIIEKYTSTSFRPPLRTSVFKKQKCGSLCVLLEYYSLRLHQISS